ncbi:FkbM family methyltransferase [Mucilaginibacter sabulilitoris]|uniref:FkbM family methyltransferase n=1 Tax=Mucilaginibacter sabulilitoris TaxID=1173583 RepID=A0ABZ0TGV1_9SPHI|nr:FkbM family methyltransferase [Mucilaginibacter sabulilitoris]WPU91642.1 FkbM family methyltransferase [Mucilaginibacter sabulilitoris]
MEIYKPFKKIKSKISERLKADQFLSNSEKKKLRRLKRYEPAKIIFLKKELRIVDSLTFLHSYSEIFINKIYKFATVQEAPVIIDCGANIGLATIYFQLNFPGARIVAFEPDPDIYEVLNQNIAAFAFKDVVCKNEAVSNRDGLLSFWPEGGHSGMLAPPTDELKSVMVKAIRLRDFLRQYPRITFLKIDIEGEEINVIPDIADELKKVDYLFLEYHAFIGKEQQLDRLLQYITRAGLRYYIKEAADKPLPFIYRELFLNMEMLVNIFCYRN